MCECPYIQELVQFIGDKLINVFIVGTYVCLPFITFFFILWFLVSRYLYFVINPSAWGHLNPSSYCDVGRLFYGVFKLWSKLQRKK